MVMLGREASESVPPPVAAPQPMRCEAALSPPSMAHAVPTRAAPAPATARPPVAAPTVPAAARAPSPSAASIPPPSAAAAASAAPAAASAAVAKPSDASASASCWEAKLSMSCAAARSTSAARCPALSSRGSTSEGRPMICGAGTSFGGGASPGGRLGMGPVQPVAAAAKGQHRYALTAAAAPAGLPPRSLRGLNAALPHAAPAWGPGRVSPSLRRACPGSVPPSSESGRKLGLVNSLGGRGKGTPVTLVGGFKRCRRVQGGVGQRGVADGLRGIGVIVEPEMRRCKRAGLAVREIQHKRLALLYVA